MKNGFTLIELSIVLVVIGLLIGGILVGQSLVDSARVNAQIKQIQQYDMAATAFRSKYKGLPGDAKVMGCVSNNCNNGVVIESVAWSAGLHSTWYWSDEVANFWANLGSSGFISGENYTATIPVGGFNTGAVKNAPEAVVNKDSSIIVASARSKWPDIKRYTSYFIADHRNITAGVIINSSIDYSLTPRFVKALDSKMDDGLPNAGMVRTKGTGSVSGAYMGWAGAAANCVVSNIYLDTEDIACNAVIDILWSVNEKQ